MHASTAMQMYGYSTFAHCTTLLGASFRVVDVDPQKDMTQIYSPNRCTLPMSEDPTTEQDQSMANEEKLEWRPGPRKLGDTAAAITAVCSISGPFTASGGVDASDEDVVKSFQEYVDRAASDDEDDGAYDAAAAGAMDLQRSVPVSHQFDALMAGRQSPDMIPDRTVTFHRLSGTQGTHFTRMIPVNMDAMKANTDRLKERQKKAAEEAAKPKETVTTETRTETKANETKAPFVPHTVNAPTGGIDPSLTSSKVAPESRDTKSGEKASSEGKSGKGSQSFNPPKP